MYCDVWEILIDEAKIQHFSKINENASAFVSSEQTKEPIHKLRDGGSPRD